MSDQRSVNLDVPLAYLSIGSNLGEREAAVLAVARRLESAGVSQNVRLSSLYETTPVGVGPMPDFVNAVVELQTLLCPEDLLKRLKAIEKMMDRRGGHNEARALDIDIIAVGDNEVRSAELTVPHPRFRERAFVLIPLRELSPEFTCPATGRSVEELIAGLASVGGVTKISGRRIAVPKNP